MIARFLAAICIGILLAVLVHASVDTKPVNINEPGEWLLFETQLEHDGCMRYGVTEDKDGALRRVFKCPDGSTHLASYL